MRSIFFFKIGKMRLMFTIFQHEFKFNIKTKLLPKIEWKFSIYSDHDSRLIIRKWKIKKLF